MKKIISQAVFILFFTAILVAQNAPKGINYQAVARDADGQLLQQKTISLKMSLIAQLPAEQIYYEEIHWITTNQFGLFNLIIGDGEVLRGNFETVPWSAEDIWMETAMDTKGGGDFKVLSTSKLLAVPYALHANTASNFSENLNPQARDEPESLSVASCLDTSCGCKDGITQLELYYFGEDNVTVEVYSDFALTNLQDVFMGVNDGDLLSVNGAPTFNTHTYFQVIYPSGDSCVTGMYTECPKPAWPGALEDLEILGKNFGNFIVYSVTDQGNATTCTMDETFANWHLGGNVVASGNNKLGSLNDENVVLVTNNLERGIITNSGDFGLGNTTPQARLDVDGTTILRQTLNVEGVTTVLDDTQSDVVDNGALVVSGGVGVARNLNVGEEASVGGNLTVGTNGVARVENVLQSTNPTDGALQVSGGAGITRNLNVGEQAFVEGDLTVGTFGVARVQNEIQSNAPNEGALQVSGGVGVAKNVTIGEDLLVIDDFTVAIDGIARIENTSQSNSPTGGALRVSGGIGVERNLSVGQKVSIGDNLTVEEGGITRTLNTQNSSAPDNGSVRISGGVGVAKNICVGGNVKVEGFASVCKIEITGGCDFAENFDVNTTESSIIPEPGMLVSIDPNNPGKLMLCQEAYDKKLAGIISGANGVRPGMVMGQNDNDMVNGAFPVALTGRVYVKTDASFGAIQPGDMLTSSPVSGFAMKVTDREKSVGAVIGKAMTSLEEGQGFVLVLVNLQ